MEKTTIMLPAEVHRNLKISATIEEMTMGELVERLVKTQKPRVFRTYAKNMSWAVTVSLEVRNLVKLASIKESVTMGCYVGAMLEAYNND